ncbi:MAG: SRPBCC domain-containing protein [Bacteroidota bacterium]|nr:SRPBCC domain-containing protein [Bacteroidota bacterium]
MERKFAASLDEIWHALTDREEMKKWYFDIEKFEPVLDFEFSFMGGSEEGTQYLHLCKITDVIPGKRLEYSWRYDGYDGISYVRFELFPDGIFTNVRLTHRGLESFPAQADFAKANFVAGWTEILSNNLTNYLNNNKS